MSAALVTGGASGIGHEVSQAGCATRVTTWWCGICRIARSPVISAIPRRCRRPWNKPCVSMVPTRVVTCAAVGAAGVLLKRSPAEWERVLAVNLTGTWLTIRAAAQAMVDAGSGGYLLLATQMNAISRLWRR